MGARRLTLALTLSAACSAHRSGGFGPAPEGGAAPPADVAQPADAGAGDVPAGADFTLSAGQWSYATQVGTARPQPGRLFVVAIVIVRNASAEPPVTVAPFFFSVETAAGVLYRASPHSAKLSRACTADASVARGGLLSCEVAFEVPSDQRPVRILYADFAMRTATTALPAARAGGA